MSEMSLSLTGLKFFAVASAIGMILSPVYEVQAFRKEGTGERHPLPYAMIALNSGLWCFYAILKNDWFPMMATNSIGAFAGYIYLSVFSYYSDPEKCRYDARKYALGVLFSEMMVAMALFMTTDQMSSDEQCDYLGMLATSILVMTFASPLIVIVQVCRTRNSSALSRPLSVLGFLCACAWTTYGKLIDDVYVWGPNGLGIMLTAMQLLVIVMYPKRSPGPSDGVSKLPQNGSKRNSRRWGVLRASAHGHDNGHHHHDHAKKGFVLMSLCRLWCCCFFNAFACLFCFCYSLLFLGAGFHWFSFFFCNGNMTRAGQSCLPFSPKAPMARRSARFA
uniref:Sugar transporter SWEET1 n=1 Tax=Lotharella globosa TaxID=91324 RepID=A0A7S4DSG2_9EUKA|mmetsp:Transcript_8132/g.15903  ORF Transcript_8132/g.15903 Transcript_8132/m.15903 type:complete len:334 (+) Transcript_8132:10-1011(+)